jgi:NADPH-dependent 7-cyano-7-deazaguanine reductase QueF-like protein
MVDRVGTTNAACKPWRRLDIWRSLTLSSSGLGHRPFTAVTRVRIPLGSRLFSESTKLFSDAFDPEEAPYSEAKNRRR